MISLKGALSQALLALQLVQPLGALGMAEEDIDPDKALPQPEQLVPGDKPLGLFNYRTGTIDRITHPHQLKIIEGAQYIPQIDPLLDMYLEAASAEDGSAISAIIKVYNSEQIKAVLSEALARPQNDGAAD